MPPDLAAAPFPLGHLVGPNHLLFAKPFKGYFRCYKISPRCFGFVFSSEQRHVPITMKPSYSKKLMWIHIYNSKTQRAKAELHSEIHFKNQQYKKQTT